MNIVLIIILVAIIATLTISHFVLLSKFKKSKKELLERHKSLKKRSNKLEKHNKELDEFAYIVSHDLKAPLRAMSTLSTFVEMDLKKGNTEKVNENLKLIRTRTARMSELIDGILDYAKSTNIIGEIEQVKVSEVVSEIVDLYKNDNIKFNIDPNLPEINSSKVVLYQIFQNLISNAIIHNNKDIPVVGVHYSKKAKFHEFQISDNGSGIEEAYLNKIFKIFQTLKPRDEFESTGIGLSIVKKIIDGMDGEISVESVVNEGVTFFVRLPILD